MEPLEVRAITTGRAPAAIGPYSQAVRVGNMLYLSGQLGVDPANGDLPEGVEAQARQSLANVAAILEAAGARPSQVVKTTVFLADMADFAAVNALYGAFFTPPYPARSCVQAAALPKGALVEIEAVCALDAP